MYMHKNRLRIKILRRYFWYSHLYFVFMFINSLEKLKYLLYSPVSQHFICKPNKISEHTKEISSGFCKRISFWIWLSRLSLYSSFLAILSESNFHTASIYITRWLCVYFAPPAKIAQKMQCILGQASKKTVVFAPFAMLY